MNTIEHAAQQVFKIKKKKKLKRGEKDNTSGNVPDKIKLSLHAGRVYPNEKQLQGL